MRFTTAVKAATDMVARELADDLDRTVQRVRAEHPGTNGKSALQLSLSRWSKTSLPGIRISEGPMVSTDPLAQAYFYAITAVDNVHKRVDMVLGSTTTGKVCQVSCHLESRHATFLAYAEAAQPFDPDGYFRWVAACCLQYACGKLDLQMVPSSLDLDQFEKVLAANGVLMGREKL